MAAGADAGAEREIVVECHLPYDFPERAYRDSNDQFRNAIVLPSEAFADLGVDPYGYVTVHPAEGTVDDPPVLHAVPFARDAAPYLVEPSGETRWVAAVRSNALEPLDGHVEPGDRVRLRPVDVPVEGPLTVGRTYDDDIAHRVCYVSEAALSRLGVGDGGAVELSTAAGDRKVVPARALAAVEEGTVRVDARSRLTLGLDLGDDVYVRPAVDRREVRRGVGHALLSRLIDYREVALRAEFGLDRDEYRNVARLNEETMEFLGIDPGDRLVVEWKGREAVTQCLSPPASESVEPGTILLPSTERDRVDCSIGDSVSVRRDMDHVLRKRTALSTFGILGVTFSVFNIAAAVDAPSYLVQRVGVLPTLVGLLGLSGGVAVVVVWLLLLPERAKCARLTDRSAR